MSAAIDGQLSAFDLPGVEPAPAVAPPFMVNLHAWQVRACGWCKKPNTIGGAAIRHPEHHDISIFYEYCEKCADKYGDPRRATSWPDFRINTDPGAESEKIPQILERIATWRTLIQTKELA